MMEYLPPPLAPACSGGSPKRAAHNKHHERRRLQRAGTSGTRTLGGAPVTEIYSIGILSAGSAFNMTVWSYVDQVDISILSDDQTFDDVHEATDAMIHSLAEIRRAAGLPAELTTVDTAMAPVKPVA